MSHFTVLVIGDDPESQLEPFSEHLEVPHREEVSLEDLNEVVNHFRGDKPGIDTELGKLLRLHSLSVIPELKANKKGVVQYPAWGILKELYQDWHGSELLYDKEGYYHMSNYNPDAKWDWHSLGGRWTGFFKPKEGAEGELGQPGTGDNKPRSGYVDQICVGDIDFDGMRADKVKDAANYFDKVMAVIGNEQPPPRWDEFRVQFTDIDKARTAYHALPVVIALNKADLMPFMDELHDCMSGYNREKHLESAAGSLISTHAVLKDGEWHEIGHMGWFGHSSNTMSDDAWQAELNKMIKKLPPDTLLSVYDCHI